MRALRAAALLAALAAPAPAGAQSVAITLDDAPGMGETPLLTPAERNGALLAALAARGVKAGIFANGIDGRDTPEGRALLAAWGRAGHMLGNHSYSHRSLASRGTTLEAYEQDVLRLDALIRELPGFAPFYRFPYLKEGDTREKRDGFREFLREHGYREAHVSIDASDWYVDQRLRARLAKDPKADLEPYRRFYLDHLWERAQYYDALARQAVGRSVRHVLLLHCNLLNALFLGDVLRMFAERGWRLTDAAEAYQDAVYEQVPDVLPAGESLLWSLARAKGIAGLRYPAENGDYESPRMDALGL